MPSGEWLTQAKAVAEQAVEIARAATSTAGSLQQWIFEQFGQNGVYASYFVGAVLGVFLLMQAIKITLAAVKYLIIPGVGLALLGSLVLPYSFFFLLPITVSACSLLLLFKG